MLKHIYKVTARGGRPFNTALEVSHFSTNNILMTVGGFMSCDPILRLTRFIYSTTAERFLGEYSDKNVFYLRPITKNPWWAAAVAIRRYKTDVYKRLRKHFPSWRPRRRFSITGVASGTLAKDVPLKDLTTGGTYVLPIGVQLDKTDIMQGFGGYHIDYDQLLAFARRMRSRVGSYFQFNSSFIGYSSGTLKYLEVENDEISYAWTGMYNPGFSTNLSAPLVTVKISRRDSDGTISVLIEGLNSIRTSSNTGFPSARFHEFCFVKFNPHNSTDDIYLPGLIAANHRIHINDFAPALYHTQSEALSAVMINLSKNYENLIESPEMYALFSEIKKQGGHFSRKFFGKLPWLQKLGHFIDLISGAYLTYSFALRPTYQALISLKEKFIVPVKGEGEMRFKKQFSELPESLRQLLSRNLNYFGLSESDIDTCDVRFRTTVVALPSDRATAQVLGESFLPLKFGILPGPQGLWETLPFSFLIDQAIPMSDLINHAESYWRGINIPCRFGHTVQVRLWVRNGTQHRHFWRSTPSFLPFDPPNASWLEAPGVPFYDIPLAIEALIKPIVINFGK